MDRTYNIKLFASSVSYHLTNVASTTCDRVAKGMDCIAGTVMECTGIDFLRKKYDEYKHKQQETVACQQREAEQRQASKDHNEMQALAQVLTEQARTDLVDQNREAKAKAAAIANNVNLNDAISDLTDRMYQLDSGFRGTVANLSNQTQSAQISRLARRITTLDPCKLDTTDKITNLYKGVISLQSALDKYISTLSNQSQTNGTSNSRELSSRNPEREDLLHAQKELDTALTNLGVHFQAMQPNVPRSEPRSEPRSRRSRQPYRPQGCHMRPSQSHLWQWHRQGAALFNPTPLRMEPRQRATSFSTSSAPPSGGSRSQRTASANMSTAPELWTDCSNYLSGNKGLALEGSIMRSEAYKRYANSQGWPTESRGGVDKTQFDNSPWVTEFAKGVCNGTIKL